jgi:hypothetical protein
MPARKLPLVLASLLCDQIIEGKDGALSVIRIIDRFLVERPPTGEAPIRFSFLLVCKKGSATETEYEGRISLRTPSGESRPLVGPVSIHFHEDNATAGINLVFVGLIVPVAEPGLYGVDAHIGEDRVASTPLEVVFPPVP